MNLMNILRKICVNPYFNLMMNFFISKTIADLAVVNVTSEWYFVVMLLSMLSLHWMDRTVGILEDAS